MIKQCIEDIVKACNGKVVQKGTKDYIEGISTDSRNIEKSSLFIPLIGERFDGHDFIEVAVKNGASAVLYKEGKKIDSEALKDIYIVEVQNTLEALQAISKYYRDLFDIPFIAITGSTGKTSTKDMVSGVLSCKYNVLKNIGNLNNHIGLPLTLFNLAPHHQMAVLEMGMSGFGEILNLTEIARPSIAVITNIGLAHIEHLGSRENIMKAKMEIANYLSDEDYLILNGDNDLLKTLKRQKTSYKKVFFGLDTSNDFYPKNLIDLGEEGFSFDMEIKGKDYNFVIKQPGIHNVYNALAAIWIGLQSKMEVEAIAEGLMNYTPSKMRMEVIQHHDIKIINDAYNASPDSMEAALSVLANMKGNRKIAVLGDMFEMGDFSEKGHRAVGACTVDKTDVLIAVGQEAKWIAEEAMSQGLKNQVYVASTNKEAVEILNNIIKSNDVILVKGSRGMAMEEIVHRLQERS
ncbi:UDP-N-acetylmuramoyl-tripeptide--D-alanyl-D-alanine ligase MurF [Clostridium aceticum]|uniref:UDP-N-acetylmuramoyl-tripeptide--D-alanyl-D-alanine ligase n=1 Tax=Clostridium aceticum TaxID=84022 RepID=A0A0D8IC50_9CLOT|nr:UDP-N-acetylmuramoyl-tripeptide--D-alanyl-D-alanine ligase [Clostridium aceticum]AKL95629.1 UDP-N-acetylmuramoyl-tripeptide--D-alanyl-D-alanine ligase MurF [Clostridium aceticum]KJF26801.1 UDP-N-acetylmuramoylalanyl-D-glutamate--2,6-diaminopimelate ligase [Clostridium aceticum]